MGQGASPIPLTAVFAPLAPKSGRARRRYDYGQEKHQVDDAALREERRLVAIQVGRKSREQTRGEGDGGRGKARRALEEARIAREETKG